MAQQKSPSERPSQTANPHLFKHTSAKNKAQAGVLDKMKPKSVLAQSRRDEETQEHKQSSVIWSYPLADHTRELFQVPTYGFGKPPGRDDSFSVSVPASCNWFRKYDNRGNVIEEGLYWGESLLVCRWVYFYDAKGKKTQANLYNRQHSLLVQCLYDEEEKLVKRLIYKDENCDEEIEYEYDETMNFVGSHVYKADGSTAQSAHLLM
jgi:hypothetical protein